MVLGVAQRVERTVERCRASPEGCLDFNGIHTQQELLASCVVWVGGAVTIDWRFVRSRRQERGRKRRRRRRK